MHQAPNASFIDIKLGTSTITLNTIAKGEAEINRRKAKDKVMTSAELGYTVSGYVKKNEITGNVMDEEFKLFPPKENIPGVFKRVFSDNQGVVNKP